MDIILIGCLVSGLDFMNGLSVISWGFNLNSWWKWMDRTSYSMVFDMTWRWHSFKSSCLDLSLRLVVDSRTIDQSGFFYSWIIMVLGVLL